MKDLKILSEISTRYGNRNINELEFKTPEDFKKYKEKHKMRPGTVVKVAGKDKVVDEPKGKKSKSEPMPQPSDFGGDMDKYTAALNKRMKDDEKSSSNEPKKSKNFNGVDYGKMKGKEPGAFDRNAVSNLLSGNPELEKELGVKSSDDYDKQRDVLGKLDLEKISKIIDKYGNDDDKESHIDRLKDDHGLESDDAKKIDKDMDKAAGDANKKMAKAELDDAISNGDGDGAMELFQSEIGFKKMGKDGKEAKALLDRLSDYEYDLIDLSTKEQNDIEKKLKQLSNKYLGESISKEDLRQLSKITTRYNK